MSWEAVGAIAELLGAIAIVVTLGYLALQIKYARLSTIDNNRENRVVGIRELNGHLVANESARAAWNKAQGPTQRKLIDDIAALLTLTDDEASLIVLQGWNWMFTHWAQYRAIKAPEDEAELSNIVGVWYSEQPMRSLIEHPGFRASFDAEFVAWVDKAIRKMATPS
jgi:hypothetical protein